MSVCTEITDDSSADSPGHRGSNSIGNSNTRTKSPTFIVTDPDSDIDIDAVPSNPRPGGTPKQQLPKPQIIEDEEHPTKDVPRKSFTESNSKTGKIPPGFFKNKVPGSGGDQIIYVQGSHNVHFGNNIFVGTNTRQPKGHQHVGDEPSPPEYEILMSSKKVVNDHHLDCVAQNIAENWKDLGRYLQLKKAAIYRLEETYKNDPEERVYQLLSEWKRGTGGPNQAPLLARLSNVLWQLREKDALDSLVKIEKDPRLNSQ